MNKFEAKIYYIYHSGFAIETQNYFLVFDYYKEQNLSKENSLFPSIISFENIIEKKNVFVSWQPVAVTGDVPPQRKLRGCVPKSNP